MSERSTEFAHTCCACFTHNNLPCCNVGHPDGPPFCETKGCRGRWGWPTHKHTLCGALFVDEVTSPEAAAAVHRLLNVEPSETDHLSMVQHEGYFSHSAGLQCDQCPGYPHVGCVPASRIEALADEWERDGFEMEAGRLREVITPPASEVRDV